MQQSKLSWLLFMRSLPLKKTPQTLYVLGFWLGEESIWDYLFPAEPRLLQTGEKSRDRTAQSETSYFISRLLKFYIFCSEQLLSDWGGALWCTGTSGLNLSPLILPYTVILDFVWSHDLPTRRCLSQLWMNKTQGGQDTDQPSDQVPAQRVHVGYADLIYTVIKCNY